VIHDDVLYDLIPGQGHGGLKCAKITDFKGYHLFHWTEFLIFDLVWRHMTFKLRIPKFEGHVTPNKIEYQKKSVQWKR